MIVEMKNPAGESLQDFYILLVELQRIELWSKHIRRKLSTCLFTH